jgi:hypothetical protein
VTPPFPVAYSEDPASSYHKIANEVYRVSKHLTTEQQNIALFWIDQGDKVGYTPAGHDMSIVTQLIEQTFDLAKAAEALRKPA